MANWAKCWRIFYRSWIVDEEVQLKRDYSDERLLFEANEEMADAYNLLARVEDPEMVEYAVLTLKAAEIRYGYLLKKLKVSRRSFPVNDCLQEGDL